MFILKKMDNVALTEELVAKVQAALETNGVEYALKVDLSPKFVIGYIRFIRTTSKCR